MHSLSFDVYKLFIFVILFSSVIGASSTTMDYRIRKDLPLITNDCFCPFCRHRLSILYQIPVISWIFLRGKCHYCGNNIPIRYPLIETAFILFYCTVYLVFNDHPTLYIASWYVFVTAFLLFRSDQHFKSLLKGLSIMYTFHLMFTVVFLMVLAALDIP